MDDEIHFKHTTHDSCAVYENFLPSSEYELRDTLLQSQVRYFLEKSTEKTTVALIVNCYKYV